MVQHFFQKKTYLLQRKSVNNVDKSWFLNYLHQYLFKTKKYYPFYSLQFLSFMNFRDMPHHITIFRKGSITYITFEWFRSFMKWCNMSIHVTLFRTAVVTNVTSKWLLSFMNWCNMFIHSTHLRTAVVTNGTFERLLSCMNWCNMSILVTLLRTAKARTTKLDGLHSEHTS